MSGEVGGFIDVVREGEEFAMPAADVITREQAIYVLDHWLENGGRHPSFRWG